MLDILVTFDVWLFRILNEKAANPVFDSVMPIITEREYFIVPLLVLWLFLFWRAGRRGRIVASLTLLVIAASDQLAAHVLKPLFGRERPPYALESVRLLVSTTSSFSFPSVHASNSFTVASFVSSFYPQTKVPLYVLACLIAYSRVYVGVHFPLDMLGGAALGVAIGLSVAAAARRLFRDSLGGEQTEQTARRAA